jgi:hypothetical protein
LEKERIGKEDPGLPDSTRSSGDKRQHRLVVLSDKREIAPGKNSFISGSAGLEL